MKKIICLALFALITLSASSQVRIEAGTSIGGFKVATLNYRAKAGITAGVFYDFGFQSSPNEFIAAGLQYTETGYNSQFNDGKVSWIQLPVESRTILPLGDKFSFIIDAGFFAGYALSRSLIHYYEYDSEPVTADISNSVRKFNFGTTIGVGLGMGRFSLRLNWQRGFLNLLGDNGYYNTNDFKTKTWRITAAFKFGR